MCWGLVKRGEDKLRVFKRGSGKILKTACQFVEGSRYGTSGSEVNIFVWIGRERLKRMRRGRKEECSCEVEDRE